MIEINHTEIFNLKGAIIGMRNPFESWEKSDSEWTGQTVVRRRIADGGVLTCNYTLCGGGEIGCKDLALAQRLISAGEDHSKFLRQIFVSMDIEAPLYWWKEMDTYKVATVANSCSTMHKLASTPITRECFSFDEELETLEDIKQYIDEEGGYLTFSETIIRNCEQLRKLYIETKDERYWRALIQLLPESWIQMRSWTANYAVLRKIYFSRKLHRLSEWRQFCEAIENLPYGKELICYNLKPLINSFDRDSGEKIIL